MLFVDSALIIYSIYTPVIIVLYILELSVIFKQRKATLNSSFYNIFSVLSIVNMTSCLVGWFVFRLPLYPIVNGFYSSLITHSWPLTAAYSTAYYLNCLSEFMGVFLAFNRFTAVYFTASLDKFWRWSFPIGTIISLLLAIAPVCQLFNDLPHFFEVIDSSALFRYYFFATFSSPNEKEPSIWLNMCIVSVVCNTLSSLLYGACIVRLCFFSITRHYKSERNFFLVGFLTMLFSLPYMAAMLIFYLNLSIGLDHVDVGLSRFITYQIPWLLDLKYLAPAPMLLITNSAIRRSITKMFHMAKTKGHSSTSKHLSQAQNIITIRVFTA